MNIPLLANGVVVVSGDETTNPILATNRALVKELKANRAKKKSVQAVSEALMAIASSIEWIEPLGSSANLSATKEVA